MSLESRQNLEVLQWILHWFCITQNWWLLAVYASTDMAHWQDPISLETICTIVKTLIPTCNDGRMSKILPTESESLGSTSIHSNLSLFWDCLNQGWLDDSSIRISKGEPRGDSDVVILEDQGTIEERSWVWKTGEVWSIEGFLALQQQVFSCNIKHFGHFLLLRPMFQWNLVYICNNREHCKGINVSRIQGVLQYWHDMVWKSEDYITNFWHSLRGVICTGLTQHLHTP